MKPPRDKAESSQAWLEPMGYNHPPLWNGLAFLAGLYVVWGPTRP
jgi:hypothetical protein